MKSVFSKSHSKHFLCMTAAFFLFAVVGLSGAQAQDYSTQPSPDASAQPQTSAPVYSQQQIDQMTAPIALYPDSLVGQILMAATYPLEVVEAYRWQQDPAHAGLQGDQLVAALQQQPWDPSVKSLTAVPQVLKTLNDNIQWTEQLGDAFLAQQGAVMDSVQRLRQRAEAAGTLGSTPQQVVTTQGPDIVITPANPDVVYVPVYNPNLVYGPWPYIGYAPYYFPGYSYAGAVIGFGAGIYLAGQLWGWDHWDWRNHRIDIDNQRFGYLNRGYMPVSNVWQHNPDHRRGVPYRDAGTQARFQSASAEARRGYRGYGAAATPTARFSSGTYQHAAMTQPAQQHFATQAQRPQVARAAPQFVQHQPARQQAVPQIQRPSVPAYESFSRGSEVRAQAARGAYSRSTTPAPSSTFHSISTFHPSAAPSRSGGGGGRNTGADDRQR